jgi:hypothetical protein
MDRKIRMSRPGGNPELKKYQFQQQYNWNESCTAKLSLRIPPSHYQSLKKIENWQEKVRVAIANLIAND